ncbi:MAG: hypothetical protein AAF517_24275, partial [Planctomycetota bacterium]
AVRADSLDGAGEPNGAQFFCFAEFAFLAIEHGLEEWRQLLPVLVRAQRVFLWAYRQPRARLFKNYSSAGAPVYRMGKEHIAALRVEYVDANLALEAGRNAAEAFAEDARYRLARRAPLE